MTGTVSITPLKRLHAAELRRSLYQWLQESGTDDEGNGKQHAPENAVCSRAHAMLVLMAAREWDRS